MRGHDEEKIFVARLINAPLIKSQPVPELRA
jgi:hypothetical protein